MAYESNSIFWIEVEKVVPNPFQPRREFDPAKLQELADSIRMYGILQPLVVTRREIMSENGAFSTEYELIAGERRLRASKLAGLTQVPVIIRSGEESQLMKLELAIIENLQREDLNAVDRAVAFKQLSEQFGLSHAQVAQKMGRSREYVSNSIRLLGLPETILNALRVNDISDGHARTLLMLNDRPVEQDVVFREILIKKLSVREVERITRKIAADKVRKKDWQNSDPELIEIERQFTETFGTRVQILKTDFGGKLTIDYFAAEDLRKVLDMVHKGESVTQGASSTKILAHIEEATPLQSVESHVVTIPSELAATVPGYVPAVPMATEMVTEIIEPQVTDEEIYTRHDSLEVPETPVSDFEMSESYVESPEVNETLNRVADAQEDMQKTEAPFVVDSLPEIIEAPAVVSVQNEEVKVETEVEDEDLYSLKNFSL
ncbi:MAG: ParB/RepB/Spo0J family partition protein [Minisyncoccia bacterium]